MTTDRWGMTHPTWYETDSGGADVEKIKAYLSDRGLSVVDCDDNGKISGYVHWKVCKGDNEINFIGNSWVNGTFIGLIIEAGHE